MAKTETVQNWTDRTLDPLIARQTELRPMVEEYQEITSLVEKIQNAQAAEPARARPSAPATMPPAQATGPQPTVTQGRGRPKGSGVRAQEFLTQVKANPGITVAQAAEKMGIKPNYIYRIANDLAKQGLIRKEGNGYYPEPAVAA